MNVYLERFARTDFMPHGYCLKWTPDLVGLHVASDAIIALSYFSIPVALLWFVRRRKDLAFSWIFLMFGAFILLCGTTHVLGIWTLWYAQYYAEGAVKAVTALVSIGTAVALWPILPRAPTRRTCMSLSSAGPKPPGSGACHSGRSRGGWWSAASRSGRSATGTCTAESRCAMREVPHERWKR